ncbi:ABC transporter ATP-binding protein [Paenibacillus koleovorans]|uniref:ABC transporter ATP-binding protein n=1 Tax=Paenibacillus koleovorans TaxID=121608 RepID=UPI001FEB3FBA|nr:ABC transporter ATP-binding protein [Paenibacillus koleovorans]
MNMGSGGGFGSGGGGGSDFGGMGRGGNRHRMRELAKTERFDWVIVRRAFRAFIPYWRRALLIVFLMLISALGGVAPAWLTQRIIDNGIMQGDIETVVKLTLLVLGIVLTTGLLGVWQSWLNNSIAQNVMADYRLSLFDQIQKQSITFFASRQSGELVSRVMNDVTAIQNVVTSTLIGIVNNLLIIASTLFLMFHMNWKLTLLSLLVVPGFVLPSQKVGRIRQKLQDDIQQRQSSMTVKLSEAFGVSGALLTQIFSRERAQRDQFDQVNTELRKLQIRQTLVGRWLFMWMGMFGSLGPAILWGYGGWLVIHNQMGIGVIVSFTALMGRLYGPVSSLTQLHVNLYSSIALFRRIFAMLDTKPQVQGGVAELAPGSAEGDIRLEDVTYAYRNKEGGLYEPVLREVNLHVRPRQMVALVGPSGAGKTTLMNLIPRFADPVEGRVLLDGRDIRELTLPALRTQMGLVPQDPFFFHDTIYSNLLFARPDASRDEIEAACRGAQIHDLIASLPEGYETVVGERGYRLSGGERQRLAIARVLLRAPRIVLLDEATSSLDTLVERQIQQALEVLMQDRTAIVIAHRLSTILKADQIVVLDGGTIAATGTHEALLESSPLYRRLYEAQFVASAEQ